MKKQLPYLFLFWCLVISAQEQSPLEVWRLKVQSHPKLSIERYNSYFQEESKLQDTVIKALAQREYGYVPGVKLTDPNKQEFIQTIYDIIGGFYINSVFEGNIEGIVFSKKLEQQLLTDTISDIHRLNILNNLRNYYDHHELFSELVPVIQELYKTKRERGLETYLFYTENVELGNLYFKMKEYPKARKNYRKAIEEEEKNFPAIFVASRLNDIGQCYLFEGKLDDARDAFKLAIEQQKRATKIADKKALKEYNLEQRKGFLKHIEANLARTENASGNNTNLFMALLDEHKYNKPPLDPNSYLNASYDLASYHYERQEYKVAQEYIDDYLHVLSSIGVRRNRKLKGLKLNAKIEYALHHIRKGDSLLKEFERFQDSVLDLKERYNLKSAIAKYEVSLVEEQIKNKNKEIALREQIQIYTIIGLFLALFSSLVIYLLYARAKKQKKIIKEQNLNLDKSLKEKEVLLKEVHHRVKNNLQVVSSFLRKQARTTTSKTVKKIMLEEQSRIVAMTLIHQQFYDGNNLEFVSLDEFIESLILNIKNSYTSSSLEVKYVTELQKIEVNLDSAIPLGLVINELIANAYKYAFHGRKKGTIFIKIKTTNQKQAKLTVQDDGVGYTETNEKKSGGLPLIKGLVWQLKGTFVKIPVENGSKFEVTYPID